MLKAAKIFFTWRVILIISVFLSTFFITPRIGYEYINPWANFDGIHYLSIAQNGYVNQAAFFPLYPILINLFSFGKYYFASGFMISNLSFFVALVYLYKLLKLDLSQKKSDKTIVFLLLFPVSFFFGAVYSESVFFLFLILSFYFARKSKWGISLLFASLLMATRFVGIFIIPALMYEYYVQTKKINFLVPFTSLGVVAYSIFNYQKWGDYLYFIHAHGQLSNGRSVNQIIFFGQTVYRYIKILITLNPNLYEWWISLLEVATFFVVSLLLYVAYKNKVRLSYLIFSVFAFLLPISSGTFTGLPRYSVILFPIFVAISYLNKKWQNVYIIVSILLSLVLSMYFAQGYFVS